MAQQTEVEMGARAATEEELAHFYKNGWVHMKALIPADLAEEMGKRGEHELLDRGPEDDPRIRDRSVWRDLYFLGRDEGVEPFHSLTRSPVIGRNAQRFMRREVPVGFHVDMFAVKMPRGHDSSAETGFHQDFPNFPLDRAGLLTFWVALDHLTPDQGTMRFLSGSHREGPLGKVNLLSDGRAILDHYRHLEELYELSPPLEMEPGDCTVHSSLVVHSAAANTTDRPRWSYLMCYYPCDALYTGAPHHMFNEAAGLEIGKPVISPKFPIIYGDPAQ